MDNKDSALLQVLKGITNLYKEDIDSEEVDNIVNEAIEPLTHKTSVQLVKKFDDEEMIAIEPLYINVGEADVHKDGVTDEDLDQLVEDFNSNIDNISGNIHHVYNTDGFFPLKAYRLPMNVYIGDPQEPNDMVLIEEGQPVVKVQFTNVDYWEKRKSGVLGGVSIGCKASREINPDYEED